MNRPSAWSSGERRDTNRRRHLERRCCAGSAVLRPILSRGRELLSPRLGVRCGDVCRDLTRDRAAHCSRTRPFVRAVLPEDTTFAYWGRDRETGTSWPLDLGLMDDDGPSAEGLSAGVVDG